jgi:K+-sensing histidine kinase KdpD
MNGVLGMTELALDTEMTPQQREYLEVVQSSADALLTVINDILDFSRIEAGKLTLELIPFRPLEVLEETLLTLALRAHSKDLEFACRIAPDVPQTLIGDPGRLRQILVNLVGNSIEFTEKGEVVVVAGGSDWDNGASELRISESDTGIGISPDKLRTIFEPFEQVDGSTTRRFGGTGLGLSISSSLVEMMGGRIMARSALGRGSTFEFSARLSRGSDYDGQEEIANTSLLQDKRILVVDHNDTNRRILCEVLDGWGAAPSPVSSEPAALRLLRASTKDGCPFHTAILDGMMPDMDGFELAEVIKSNPRLQIFL